MFHDERASGGALTAAVAERTARQRALPFVGDVGQRRLAASRVLVVGAGGLAHPAAQYLAGSGVGRLDVVDHDVVEPSNLARQLSFTADDLGKPKAAALAAALVRVAPDATIVGHGTRIDERLARDLIIRLAPDVVIDTTDDWDARFAVADACRALGIPLVWASVIGTDGQLTVFSSADGDPGVDDLVDRATARHHPVSCADQGVLGSVCGLVGAMAATEAIKLLLGAGRPLIGRLAVVDALGASVRDVPLQARRKTRAATRGEARDDADSATVATPPAASRAPSVQLVTLDELAASPLGTVLIDVRASHSGPLPWSPPGLELVELIRSPLESLSAAIDRGELPTAIDRASRVVVACAFGPRARHAAAMLRAAGVPGVVVLDEGTGGIRAAAAHAQPEVAHG